MKGMKDFLYRILIIIAFLLLWKLFSSLYSSIFFPGPLEVFISFMRIFFNINNYIHILLTSFRVFAAIFISLFVGTIIGILPSYNRGIKYVIETVIYPILNSVPLISWSFLVTIWFGLSNFSVIFTISTAILPVYIVNVYEGVKELENDLIELGYSFTDNRLKILRKIVLPQLYPNIFSSLRRSLGDAWKVVLIAEIFTATSGIGYKINIAAEYYNVVRIMAWTLLIVMIILFFDNGVFNYIDKKWIRKWKIERG